jgi:hypothetical protein
LILTVIFAICAVIFIVVSAPFALWLYIVVTNAIESRSWPSINGTIESSHIVRNRDCNGLPGYHYLISFDYKIDEQDYCSTSVKIGDFRYLTRAVADKMVEKYPTGHSVKVFYDPDYPDVSVLEPGFSWECFYPIVLFLIVLGIGLFFLTLAIIRLFG